jgi:hypothetical protein
MKQKPSRETDGHSAGQQILFLCNPNVHYRDM